MEITISVTDTSPRGVALSRAMDTYNRNQRNPPLNEVQFLQKLVDSHLDTLVGTYVVTTVSKLEFLDRFTVNERVAIREAAKASAAVNDYLELLNAAQVVDLTSARTTGGVAALEAAGLIAAGRGATILAL